MIRSSLKVIFACALLNACGTDKEDKNNDAAVESLDDFFENLEYPEYKFKAKKITHRDADDNVSAETVLTYTDSGKIEKRVRTAETGPTSLLELNHQQTVVFSYNSDNQAESSTTYSDEDMKTITNESKYEYTDGYLSKSTHNSLNAAKEVVSSFVSEYDKFHRQLVTTNTSKSADKEDVSVETCVYDEEKAFTKKTCTTVYNEVKSKVVVEDQTTGVRTETTFTGEDDEEGSVVVDATLFTDYQFIGSIPVVKTQTKDYGTSTVTTSCEISTESDKTMATCTETTSNSKDEKTSEIVTVRELVKKTFSSNAMIFDGYITFAKSIKITEYTDDKIVNVSTDTYERNDKYLTVSHTSKSESADSDEKLKVISVNVSTYTYDNDGERILEMSKERTEGEGEIPGSNKTVYEYE